MFGVCVCLWPQSEGCVMIRTRELVAVLLTALTFATGCEALVKRGERVPKLPQPALRDVQPSVTAQGRL